MKKDKPSDNYYPDTGCELSESCLDCPYTEKHAVPFKFECKETYAHGKLDMVRYARASAMISLAEDRVSVAILGEMFNMKPSAIRMTIHRYKEKMDEDSKS